LQFKEPGGEQSENTSRQGAQPPIPLSGGITASSRGEGAAQEKRSVQHQVVSHHSTFFVHIISHVGYQFGRVVTCQGLRNFSACRRSGCEKSPVGAAHKKAMAAPSGGK
jgi:hypothetical protein